VYVDSLDVDSFDVEKIRDNAATDYRLSVKSRARVHSHIPHPPHLGIAQQGLGGSMLTKHTKREMFQLYSTFSRALDGMCGAWHVRV